MKKSELRQIIKEEIFKVKGSLNMKELAKNESVVTEAVKEVVLSNEILDFLEERGILKASDAQKVHKDLTAFLKEKGINESVNEPIKKGDKFTSVDYGKTINWLVVKYDKQSGAIELDNDHPRYSKFALSVKDFNNLVEKGKFKSINESYRRFKKKVTNPRQQMNNSVREIEKHLREVDRIVEYNLKLKTEMDLGAGNFFEGTNKRLARISERINHLNNKLKELGNWWKKI